MERILFFILASITTTSGCTGNSDTKKDKTENSVENKLDSGIVQCPYGHKDSIIPIVYGYPNEEDFRKSDSGLIALGGCELPENPQPWFCKIHNISF